MIFKELLVNVEQVAQATTEFKLNYLHLHYSVFMENQLKR